MVQLIGQGGGVGDTAVDHADDLPLGAFGYQEALREGGDAPGKLLLAGRFCRREAGCLQAGYPVQVFRAHRADGDIHIRPSLQHHGQHQHDHQHQGDGGEGHPHQLLFFLVGQFQGNPLPFCKGPPWAGPVLS